MVIEKHLTCLLREGFCQEMCKPSLIFSWYFVVAVSKIEKQSAVQLSKQSVNSFTCLYTCEALSVFKCSFTLVEKCLAVSPIYTAKLIRTFIGQFLKGNIMGSIKIHNGGNYAHTQMLIISLRVKIQLTL